MAEKTLTAMQRMAVRAVMTLKHLQTIKKGSGLVLSIVLLVWALLLMALEDEDVLPTLSPSPFRPIFSFFFSFFLSELALLDGSSSFLCEKILTFSVFSLSLCLCICKRY